MLGECLFYELTPASRAFNAVIIVWIVSALILVIIACVLVKGKQALLFSFFLSSLFLRVYLLLLRGLLATILVCPCRRLTLGWLFISGLLLLVLGLIIRLGIASIVFVGLRVKVRA